MVRYERSSISRRCCFPFFNGLRRPFKPKIIRLLLSILFCGLSFALMIFSGHWASVRAKAMGGTLSDLLFEWVPKHDMFPIPEVLLFALLTTAIGRMIFHPDGLAIARRFTTVAGCIYVLRSFTLIATALPDPEECEKYEPTLSFSALLKDRCGDMMGHTVNLTLAALVWSQYTKYRLVALLAWAISITAMLLFIANQSHYSIDVLISLMISIFCWKYYHQSMHLPRAKQNPIISWLEKPDYSAAEGERDRGVINSSEGLRLTTIGIVNEGIGNSPVPSKYKELIEANSPGSKFKELIDSPGSKLKELIDSPGNSKFSELIDSPGPSRYKELNDMEEEENK